MKKQIIAGALCAAIVTSLPVWSAGIKETEAKETAAAGAIETSASLTEEWFGNTNTTGILSDARVKQLAPVLKAYEEAREQSFLGEVTLKEAVYGSGNTPILEASEAVEADEGRRADLIAQMQERMGIEVTDAVTTVLVRGAQANGGQLVLTLYEWTFFDYLDPEGDGVTTDVSGFGTEHVVTLKQDGFGYVVVSDTYDEGDLTGMQSSDYEAEAPEISVTPKEQSYGASYAAGYDPDKAAAYADKYVREGISGEIDESAYNLKDYISMNGAGRGDCTNYVSQCIHAGGMMMDDEWYYISPNSYTAAWSTSRYHYPYMSTRGRAIENPSASDIYKGSPVYYQSGSNISHTTICVGTNSAGVPIIDSHNKDYYHVRWNYWGDSTTYYTVQLTKSNGVSNLSTPAPTATPRPVITTDVYGDLDDNGRVDASDALEILKGVVKLHTFTEKDLVIGDVDLNGVVDASDALLVLKKTVHMIDAFPAGERLSAEIEPAETVFDEQKQEGF